MSNQRAVLVSSSMLIIVACGSSSAVERQVAELTAIAAEKDSLLLQVTDNARLMSEISVELVRVKAPAMQAAAAEAGMELDGDAVLAEIRGLTARVLDSEERLLRSQERIEALTRDNVRLAGQLTDFQRAVGDFQTTITNQKQTITALTQQVHALSARNARLAADNEALAEEKLALADSMSAIEARNNAVYFVIGTKEELLERGIIEEEGGSRVLFVFGRRGRTIVPARDLDPAQFTPIDKRQVLDIPMPWANRTYRIASRQDLGSLATRPDEEGAIRGTLRIADPERFWEASRFLILVQS